MAGNGGVWFDTKTEKVVTSQPEEGVQLTSPNTETTPDEERVIDLYKNPDSDGDKTVTTKAGK